MKYGSLVFLAALIALTGSWCGFVLAPQIQIGRSVQEKAIGTGDLYPLARPGMARQGLEIYRANGCVYCHSQQVGQEGTICEIALTDMGTNAAATVAVIGSLNPAPANAGAKDLLAGLPKIILQVADMNAADPAIKLLEAAGAKADVDVKPQGPDIVRGWGGRRTVAQDYLYDYPIQLGSRRVGPDLANIGLRRPDVSWHLRHLYAPTSEVKGSTMPPYRFLFETRKIGREASPDALKLPAELAPKPGYEIVPKAEAKALVAYLLSLHADASLFESPVTSVSASVSVTNSMGK